MASSGSVPAALPVPKKRGSYNCGRCGLPKKGHVCSIPGPAAKGGGEGGAGGAAPGELKPRRALHFDDVVSEGLAEAAVPLSVAAPHRPPEKKARVEVVDVEETAPRPPGKTKARVEVVVDDDEGEEVSEGWVEVGAGRRVPGEVVVEVLRRLAPRAVAASAGVSRGWRECARRVWRAAEEVRLRTSGVRPVGALLTRCPALARLVLRMDSDVDATMLACIAFSCPNLQSLDISMANSAVNRITGDEINRFVSEKRYLSVLKLDGCSSLGFLNISCSSLSTLWLSGLCSLTKVVINCPNLNELSLDFPKQDNDSTDLVALMDGLGRTCPNLRNMHISSIHLCNEAVFALESANLRGLCMLSLILGSKITDAAVASIVRSYASLELLDLSGSSITDNGLGMICKAFPHTLTRFLLALCPNITSCGVQAATSQLPLLRLMDCGKSLCANLRPEAGRSYLGDITGGIRFCSKLATQKKQQPTYQKMIIKHNNLKKLSLWGCSAIDALYVNCPELVDLNLNSCTNLHPERLLLQCPNLKDVHVSGCRDMLIGAIRNQVLNEFAAVEPRLPCKRLADGSKRVQVPHFMLEQLEEAEKWGGSRRSQCNVHLN
ncbi:F-box/LRR-repeat protein 17-like [Phragmites australis]|uniref:F-box/LRR-repeat protein 17-like n=1 Tax=Phragmites australis TaxID=29695 RepID=UPI002D783732|nr:F-box/LRR-repeat protein 17-like [Phragmites australis]